MYSMVLMMALNSGAAAPAGLFSSDCGGCCGGYSACCGAAACNACCGGWSCHGCCGGHGFGLFGGWFNKGCCGGWSSCHGCCGGWSSCHGCCGGHVVSYNCGGCCGGGCCGGYACHGCHGCHGGGLFSGLFNRGCHGCYGCHGCAGCDGAVVPGTPAPAPAPAPKKEEKKADAGDNTAKLIVSLPADAKLIIDDEATTSTSGVRTFITPELTAGEEYVYNLKAELTRDGKTFTATQRVTVRAGEETKTSLQFPVETAAK